MRLFRLLPIFFLPAAAFAADESTLEQRRERLQQKREQQFREADADASRGLSPAEIGAAGLPRALLERFDEIDADRDGALSPEELQSLDRRRLEQARGGPRP